MPLPMEKRYTYADLMNWDGEERYELVDGELTMMSPPKRAHQHVVGALSGIIWNYLRGKRCKVYAAPFAVCLFVDKKTPWNQIDTVLEPDLSIVCDPDKLDEDGCKGAPDMVAEVLSPSTQKRDFLEKFRLYQRAGVKEYWIVDPDKKTVLLYTLKDGILVLDGFYEQNDSVKVKVLDSCEVNLAEVFDYEQ